jgi:hypothetical protein
MRIAIVAAAVLAAIALSGMVLSSRPGTKPITHGPIAAALSPDSSASPAGAAAPESSPAPVLVAAASSFTCRASTLTGRLAPAVSAINSLRTASHGGYDRLTVQFISARPGTIEVRPQSGTDFTLGASGRSTRLAGTNGILVVMHGADLHTRYSGPLDLKPRYASLIEVRQIEDFEGVVQLGLGLNGPACYRATVLANPSRLVIDVQV